MEALAEQLVATYLTRGGKVFIVPQYPVPGDRPDTEWSCPDFVALNFEVFEHPEVLVIEVTTGSDFRTLSKKIAERSSWWFDRIRSKLQADGIIDQTWPIRFIGFVRRANIIRLISDFDHAPDVSFVAIEDVTFAWDYWEKRKAGLGDTRTHSPKLDQS